MATDARAGPVHTLVLSPHYDDAVFSCGGLIARLTAAGRQVLVATVCAAPPAARLSPYAASLHRRWGASSGAEPASAEAMIAHRRAEDEAALARIGATGAYLDLPDCIYRTDPGGDWLYQGDEAIFGPVASADAPAATRIAAAMAELPVVRPDTRVLAPLAVGNHVDHQLVRAAAERFATSRGLRLGYYEDMPYAAAEGAVAAVLGDEAGWRPRLHSLGADHLSAKIAAMAEYASQIGSFWPDEAIMAGEVRSLAYRRSGGRRPAERLWERARPVAAGR